MAHQTKPADLPVPIDDGACNHLLGSSLPPITLPTTSSTTLSLTSLPTGLTIIFLYPRTGAPSETIPASWNAIPGARGCTPQACSFRDSLAPLKAAGVSAIYGLSTQSTEYQQEVVERLGLGYELLSDEKLEFVKGMGIPTLEWEGKTLCKRVTIAVEAGKVVRVWYPVFPTEKSAEMVLEWLEGGRK